jgi:hypothetical protein
MPHAPEVSQNAKARRTAFAFRKDSDALAKAPKLD